MKLKSFLEAQFNEDVHPKVLGALRVDPPRVLDNVLKARDDLKKTPDTNSGLADHEPAKGSSRAVLQVKNDHKAVVDGKHASLKGIVKMAYGMKGNHGKLTGQMQNKVEASKHVQKFATLVRDGKKGFKTNPDGVVPPLFSHGNDHSFIHIGHADNVSREEFQELTKTKSHPGGITTSHVTWATDPKEKNNRSYDHVRSHPLVQKVAKFRKATKIADFHQDNWGVWTHPHTSEKHLVLRDAGFNRQVAKDYGYGGNIKTVKDYNPTAATKSLHIPDEHKEGTQFSLGMKGGKAKKPRSVKVQYARAMKKPDSARLPSEMGVSTLARQLKEDRK